MKTAQGGRILELDALRGIAALGVVFWHYRAHFDARPLSTLLYPFYNAGFLLVDFFFVLSGYVIARAYWRESRQNQLFQNVWSRIARLYPLHLCLLLISAGLVISLPAWANNPNFELANDNLKHFLLNLFLLNQVGLQNGFSFDTPAWSISTEFVTNIAFLAFIALSTRSRVALVIGLAAAMLLLVIQHPGFHQSMAFGYVDESLLRCLLGFGTGVGLYLLLDRLSYGSWFESRAPLSNGLATCSLIAMVYLMIASRAHPPSWHYLASICVATGCVGIVPQAPFVRNLLRTGALVFLGDISYSIYLVHYPLQLALYSVTQRFSLRLDYRNPLVLFGFLALVLGLAAVTQRYLELPAQRGLLKHSPRRRSSPAESASIS